MSKLAKDSVMLTVDAHLKNKKEDVLLHTRLDQMYHGHRIVLSTLQQESTTVSEDLQNLLTQKTILRKFKLDDLIKQIKAFNKGDKAKNSNDDSMTNGRAQTAPSSTVSNLQSGQRRASLLGAWAGIDGRTSPNSFVQDEIDGRFSTNQYMKNISHMSASVNSGSSGPPGFRRSKSIVSLGGRIADGGDAQCLTHKELRRMASIESIYQKEMERQKLDRLQEREKFRKFLDEKRIEKVNDFLKTLDKKVN
ncbi:uncharacterized protein LOC119967936 [Scyliorhinus canicula]|uniref:uncharacterized protein LOC119967936 n=1 Tax=Scyliorhinus canicula TaxID=7830 RepID=UPI0018F32B41|nr:uncharacterized protein LOC119967936 [Scyliorhinus canicula]